MKSSEGLHLKTFVLLLVMVTFGPLGDAFLGKGMRRLETAGLRSPADLFHFFLRAFSSETVWIGILLAGDFFCARTPWCFPGRISASFSLLLRSSYAIVALLGHYFLSEFVSPTRWIGILIICAGVLVRRNHSAAALRSASEWISSRAARAWLGPRLAVRWPRRRFATRCLRWVSRRSLITWFRFSPQADFSGGAKIYPLRLLPLLLR